MDYRAEKKFRVRSRREISLVFDNGRRKSDRLLMVFALHTGGSATRCAVAVSSRHGNAVKRNRIKRLCREAFRLSRHQLPAGWDFVMLPRVGAELTVAGLQTSLKSLVRSLTEEVR